MLLSEAWWAGRKRAFAHPAVCAISILVSI